MSLLRHVIAVLVLPFTVTVVIPAAAVAWRGAPYVRAAPPVVIGAGVLGALAVLLVAWTVGLFGAVGKGTLAPWAPPQRLVVRGPYRHVRNPMMLGVMGILLAAALATQSALVAGELALFVLVNAISVPVVEERGLLARFVRDYEVYARNVPRWAPRLTAWRGADDGLARRAPDDLVLATLPRERVRGLVVVHTLVSAALVGLVLLLVGEKLSFGPGALWVLLALAVAWALLDLRDAWIDALHDPPPQQVFGRMHDDGRTFELREEPGGRPVAGWRFVRRDKGAFVLMRKRLASRALVRSVRPTDRPFRMAVLYEPEGRPDAEGWIRYPASAAWEDPPGAWQAVRA